MCDPVVQSQLQRLERRRVRRPRERCNRGGVGECVLERQVQEARRDRQLGDEVGRPVEHARQLERLEPAQLGAQPQEHGHRRIVEPQRAHAAADGDVVQHGRGRIVVGAR